MSRTLSRRCSRRQSVATAMNRSRRATSQRGKHSPRNTYSSSACSRFTFCQLGNLLSEPPLYYNYNTNWLLFILKNHYNTTNYLPRFDVSVSAPVWAVMSDSLHWLSFPQRVTFKLCLITYKCLHGLAPWSGVSVPCTCCCRHRTFTSTICRR